MTVKRQRKAKAKRAPRKMGRPTLRTDAVIARVLSGLREGTPLTVICAPDDMPSDDSVRNWADADEELSRAIARAREVGFDKIALDALTIADTPLAGEIITKKPVMVDGKAIEGAFTEEVKTEDMLGHRKLQVDTRLKLLAKWDPKRYGDAMLHKHADADGEKLPIDEVTRAARLAAIASQINAQQQKGEDAPD